MAVRSEERDKIESIVRDVVHRCDIPFNTYPTFTFPEYMGAWELAQKFRGDLQGRKCTIDLYEGVGGISSVTINLDLITQEEMAQKEEIEQLKKEKEELTEKLRKTLMDFDWYKKIEVERIKLGYEQDIKDLRERLAFLADVS